MGDSVLVDIRGSVAHVTLNRPQVLNALDQRLKIEIAEAMRKCDTNPDVRVVVLAGEGRAFCAGQDQKESAEFSTKEAAATRIEHFVDMCTAVRSIAKPVIAQVHGYAVGAGLQLALVADLRIAAASSKLGLTELNVGSACITGSSILWPIAGEAVVKRLVLTGEFVDGQEALKLGLVHEVVDDAELPIRVTELASQLSEKASYPMKLTKAWWRELTEEGFQQAVAHAYAAHGENFEAGALSSGAKNFVGRAARKQ